MKRNVFHAVFALVCLAGISACQAATTNIPVAVFVDQAPQAGATPFSIPDEQGSGYKLAENGAASNLSVKYQIENTFNAQIQKTVRNLTHSENEPIFGIVGASSNDESSELAALSNFFNIPVVIVGSMGDGLFPSDNFWAFLLSARGKNHYDYLFGSVVNSAAIQAFGGASELGPDPLKLGIWYQKDVFDETSAANVAQAAVEQGIEVVFYGRYNATALQSKAQAQQMADDKIALVYLIADTPKAAFGMLNTLHAVFPVGKMPVIIGQSGAFSSIQVLASPNAQGLFVLQQKIVKDKKCPAAITSLFEAQSYAALALFNEAVQQASSQEKNFASEALQTKRQSIREALKTFHQELPCLGLVSFDNAGRNQNAQFDILQVTEKGPTIIPESEFLLLLKQVYYRSPFD